MDVPYEHITNDGKIDKTLYQEFTTKYELA